MVYGLRGLIGPKRVVPRIFLFDKYSSRTEEISVRDFLLRALSEVFSSLVPEHCYEHLAPVLWALTQKGGLVVYEALQYFSSELYHWNGCL